MRAMAWLVCVLPPLVGACDGAMSELSTEEALTLRAISGEEEDLQEGEGLLTGTSDGERGRPPLFRECDAPGARDAQVTEFDADGDGAVSEAEGRPARGDKQEQTHHEHAWRMLLDVYDLDADGALSETEDATLLEDFTVRCEAIHARLIADFDVDGDGQLSEEEQLAVQEEREARHAEREAAMSEEGGPPPRRGGQGAPPAAGEAPDTDGGRPPRGEGTCEGRPDHLDRWDADGDGVLSEEELGLMRATMRELIRSGAPLHPEGAPPPPEGAVE
jgi:Ca2+-binding EF-hand superfamily protein